MSRTPAARLDRLLANLGYGSRRDVQQIVSEGGVTLDGAVLRDAGGRIALVADLADRMQVRGQRLDPPAPLSLMLHKPLGLVCSHREPGRSIYELLPPRWRARDPALSSIGRLDLDTSGLLIVTDDGALLHRIISPRSQVTKRYRVGLAQPLRGDEAELFAAGGLLLEGETTPLAPAELTPLGPASAYLVVTEGRYHQVRRMFAAVGNHVEALHRDRVGGLDLPNDLAPGAWRVMNEAERTLLTAPA